MARLDTPFHDKSKSRCSDSTWTPYEGHQGSDVVNAVRCAVRRASGRTQLSPIRAASEDPTVHSSPTLQNFFPGYGLARLSLITRLTLSTVQPTT